MSLAYGFNDNLKIIYNGERTTFGELPKDRKYDLSFKFTNSEERSNVGDNMPKKVILGTLEEFFPKIDLEEEIRVEDFKPEVVP